MKNVVIFLAGALVGAGITNFIVKTKYEKIANEEIASVKEVYSRKKEKSNPENFPVEDFEKTNQEESVEDDKVMCEAQDKYEKILNETRYKNYEEPVEEKEVVYFIEDDQYGFEYAVESLDYFAGDNKIVNEMGEVMSEEDVEAAIGDEWRDKFENCGYDKVYIRNDVLETDYEIVLDHGSWEG